MPTSNQLVEEIEKEFPTFKIVLKTNSTFMKVLDVLLKIISFGQLKNFMTRFTTMIGYTMYVTETWEKRSDASRYITLRHERIHMRQRKRLGSIWFSISYLLLPVPAVWSYFRMKYEMEAYAESMLATLELFGPGIFTNHRRELMISYFTSSAYLWTWPWKKRVEQWYDSTVAELMKTRVVQMSL